MLTYDEHELRNALLRWVDRFGRDARIVGATENALANEVADRVNAEYAIHADRRTLARIFLRATNGAAPLIELDAEEGMDAARMLLTRRGKERLMDPQREAGRLALRDATDRMRAQRARAGKDVAAQLAAKVEALHAGSTVKVEIHHAGAVQIGTNEGVVASAQGAGVARRPDAPPRSDTPPRPWIVKTWNDNVKAVVSLTSLTLVLIIAILATLGLIPGVDVGAWITANLFGLPK